MAVAADLDRNQASVLNITTKTTQVKRLAVLTYDACNEGIFAAVADMGALALLYANLGAVVCAGAAAWPMKLQHLSLLSVLRNLWR